MDFDEHGENPFRPPSIVEVSNRVRFRSKITLAVSTAVGTIVGWSLGEFSESLLAASSTGRWLALSFWAMCMLAGGIVGAVAWATRGQLPKR